MSSRGKIVLTGHTRIHQMKYMRQTQPGSCLRQSETNVSDTILCLVAETKSSPHEMVRHQGIIFNFHHNMSNFTLSDHRTNFFSAHFKLAQAQASSYTCMFSFFLCVWQNCNLHLWKQWQTVFTVSGFQKCIVFTKETHLFLMRCCLKACRSWLCNRRVPKFVWILLIFSCTTEDEIPKFFKILC